MINAHPNCAMSDERYSKIYGRGAIAPKYFTPAAINDEIDDPLIELAKPQLDVVYKAFSRNELKIVGDKYPSIFRIYDQLFDNLDGVKVAYIFRNPLSVIESYQARLELADPTHDWDPARDYRVGMSDWNDSLRMTLDAKKRYGKRIGVFTYERVLFEKTASDIFFEEFLGLERLPDQVWKELLEPSLQNTTTDKEKLRFAFLNADTDAYRAMTELALDKDVPVTG